MVVSAWRSLALCQVRLKPHTYCPSLVWIRRPTAHNSHPEAVCSQWVTRGSGDSYRRSKRKKNHLKVKTLEVLDQFCWSYTCSNISSQIQHSVEQSACTFLYLVNQLKSGNVNGIKSKIPNLLWSSANNIHQITSKTVIMICLECSNTAKAPRDLNDKQVTAERGLKTFKVWLKELFLYSPLTSWDGDRALQWSSKPSL